MYDIHIEHYKDLLDCKTLDEAKEKYPEFKDVINAKDIDISSLNKNSSLYKISQGKIKGISLDTLSLEFLKKYYGKLYSSKKQEEYWELSENAVSNTASALNIKLLNRKYATTAAVQSLEIKEKISAQHKDLGSGYHTKECKRKKSRRKKPHGKTQIQVIIRKNSHKEKVKQCKPHGKTQIQVFTEKSAAKKNVTH